jgi:hypothetical protein
MLDRTNQTSRHLDLVSIRQAAERIAAGTDGGLHIVSISATPTHDGRLERPRATFEALNDELAFSRQFLEAANARELIGVLRTVAPSAKRRSRLRDRLRISGGVAIVDDLVETALRHVGCSVGMAVAGLRSGTTRVLSLARPGTPALKAWMVDGRLVCSFEIDAQVRWTSERLLIRLPLGAVLQASLKGRSLANVVEHPMFPGRIRITSCDCVGNENELALRLPTRIIDRRELGS